MGQQIRSTNRLVNSFANNSPQSRSRPIPAESLQGEESNKELKTPTLLNLHFEDNSKDQEGSCRRHRGCSRLVNSIMVPSSSVSTCPEANIPTAIENSVVPPNLSECNAPTLQENETSYLSLVRKRLIDTLARWV